MTRRKLKRQSHDIMRGKPSGPGWLLAGLLLALAILAIILQSRTCIGQGVQKIDASSIVM